MLEDCPYRYLLEQRTLDGDPEKLKEMCRWLSDRLLEPSYRERIRENEAARAIKREVENARERKASVAAEIEWYRSELERRAKL